MSFSGIIHNFSVAVTQFPCHSRMLQLLSLEKFGSEVVSKRNVMCGLCKKTKMKTHQLINQSVNHLVYLWFCRQQWRPVIHIHISVHCAKSRRWWRFIARISAGRWQRQSEVRLFAGLGDRVVSGNSYHADSYDDEQSDAHDGRHTHQVSRDARERTQHSVLVASCPVKLWLHVKYFVIISVYCFTSFQCFISQLTTSET